MILGNYTKGFAEISDVMPLTLMCSTITNHDCTSRVISNKVGVESYTRRIHMGWKSGSH